MEQKKKSVNLSKYDIIVPYLTAHSIIDKVIKKKNKFVSSVAWNTKPFGLRGYHFDRYKEKNVKNPIYCVCKGRQVKQIAREDIPKNIEKVNEYQVVCPKSSGGGKGKRDKILPKPKHFFILEKGQISTETYNVVHSFRNKKEAKNFLSFLRTNFSRFLLGIRKPTQDAKKDTFSWIPLMNTKKLWTDEMLFKYF